MSYRLKSGEPVPAGIRRIVREEIESAARQLSGQGEADRDVAVHEARKSMKKVRGVLRLMRPELDSIYRAENACFRDVGRELSHLRDAGAMIEAFDALIEKSRHAIGRRKLASIRRGLVARRQRRSQEVDVLPPLAATLRSAAHRVSTWPLANDGFAALAPGLQTAFGTARKALASARKNPSPENFHEWRKRVKDHWYDVRLLEDYWDRPTAEYEKNLKQLETWLGEDHNLTVLRETVLAKAAFYGPPPDIAMLAKLTAGYQSELRAKALDLGRHIYAEKPRQFTSRFRGLWESRQARRLIVA